VRYLLDTDILNYLLKETPLVEARFAQACTEQAEFILCPVVHYQAVRYFHLKGAFRMLRKYNRLVASWTFIEIDGGDWDTAAGLWADRRRAGRPIEDADLLIAVTALKTGAVLVTNNLRHFDGLGLTLENWTVEQIN
jgi:tRNA(fMet)-specific endonuclease VapC